MSSLLTLPEAGALSIRAKALVFEDPSSSELLRRTEQVARTQASVLIIGETGTGKELLARRVHQASERRGPFIAVNCGAFSESLIDAELFGHESGAFTGAHQARAGWFEAAQGGTLFLDEIGDLPLPLQVKLLRVLQERQIVRLGSRKTIDLNVRLVAATNVDLLDAVRAGRFRSDLYYRLSVATLALRPLCERRGDILPLAQHFLAVHASALGIAHATLDAQAREALLQYDWPGNIRELENAVHYALIVAPGGLVRADDLQLIHRRSRQGAWPESVAAPGSAVPAAEEALEQAVARIAREALQRQDGQLFERFQSALVHAAFEHTQGRQVPAARALGISRNVVRTLFKRHGLLQAPQHDGENASELLDSPQENGDAALVGVFAAGMAPADGGASSLLHGGAAGHSLRSTVA